MPRKYLLLVVWSGLWLSGCPDPCASDTFLDPVRASECVNLCETESPKPSDECPECREAPYAIDCPRCVNNPEEPGCQGMLQEGVSGATSEGGDGGEVGPAVGDGDGAAGGEGGGPGGDDGDGDGPRGDGGGSAGDGGKDGGSAGDGGKDGGSAGDGGKDGGSAGDGGAGDGGPPPPPCSDGCGAETPLCERTQMVCVECLGKGDCSEAERSFACKNNACVACDDHDHCKDEGAGYCDPERNECVMCLDDDDCSGGVCEHNVCIGCRQDGDCPGGVCDSEQQECFACLDDDDCGGTKPHCTSERECVECLEHDHCTDATAAQCAGGECVGCDENDHCDGVSGKGVCDDEVCVQCTRDDYGSCDGSSCDGAKRSCTATPLGSIEVCGIACRADSECEQGARCVEDKVGSKSVGRYCFFVQDFFEDCGDDYRPYSSAESLTSVDGRGGTYCLPPSTTSCAGMSDMGRPCDNNETCGVPSVEDGFCSGTSPIESRCTIQCSSDSDCPVAGYSTCNDSGNRYCRP